MSHLFGQAPKLEDAIPAILGKVEAATTAARFQVIVADFDESVRTTDGKSSVLVCVAMPLGDPTVSNIEVLRKGAYVKGTKYSVGAYNISHEALNGLPGGPEALKHCLSVYPLTI